VTRFGPSLAASSNHLYCSWRGPDDSVNVRDLNDNLVMTLGYQSYTTPATACLLDNLSLLLSHKDHKLSFFYLDNPQQRLAVSRPAAASPPGSDYVTAEVRVWGIRIDLSDQAVNDAQNGLNLATSIATALALTFLEAPAVAVTLGLTVALLTAGGAVLGLINRGQGVSLLLPWSSFVPIMAPYGPGGIVIPVPR
jgi:hypothetical protein